MSYREERPLRNVSQDIVEAVIRVDRRHVRFGEETCNGGLAGILLYRIAQGSNRETGPAKRRIVHQNLSGAVVFRYPESLVGWDLGIDNGNIHGAHGVFHSQDTFF